MIEQRTVYTSYGKDFNTLGEAEAFNKIRQKANGLDNFIDLKYEDNWVSVIEKLNDIGFDVVSTVKE